MTQRTLTLSSFLLISVIVLNLALPVAFSLPFFVLRFSSVVPADRLFPNSGALHVWRPLVPSHSQIETPHGP